MSELRVVAIDGPSGSGKSTVARALAAELGLACLDTGAMYRAVAAALLALGLELDDESGATDVARRMHLDPGVELSIDGHDVAEAIRSPEVTDAVSLVAAHPAVRAVLVDRQRQWVRDHDGGVVEGRDIGTVVFPDAALKLYLTASDEERAARRRSDVGDGAHAVGLEVVRASLQRRDRLDSSRSASPLRVAADAREIDTTGRTVDEVVAAVLAVAREVFAT